MLPFELKDQDLKELNAGKAVEFFRRLIWLEAERVGIRSNLIDVPLDIYSPDGGIDAYIENANPSSDDVIPIGNTGFQIKSGKFYLSKSIKELYKFKRIDGQLKSGIKEILDKDGTYIQVLFSEPTYTRKRADYNINSIESGLIEELKKNGYTNPKIRVYTITQILGFCRRFPSLTIYLRPELMPYKNFDSWSQNKDIEFPVEYYLDEERIKIIEEIRKILRDSNSNCLRISGFPGIGKTRLIHEVLNVEDLKNLVMYIEAERFYLSEGYDFLKNSEDLSVIIVLDNCSKLYHEKIINSIFTKKSRIKIISIALEREEPLLIYCKSFQIPYLEREVLKRMIKNELNEISPIAIKKILDFVGGFPKVAVMLIQYYNLHPNKMVEDIKEIKDNIFVNRLIGGELDPFTQDFVKIKKVFTYLSLFGNLGFIGQESDDYVKLSEKLGIPLPFENIFESMKSLSEETKWIANYIGIEWNEFKEIIKYNKQRGLIHGKYKIYLTPYPLRTHLINEWWMYSENEAYDLIFNIPSRLRHNLTGNFFIHTSVFVGISNYDLIYKNIIKFCDKLIENSKEEFYSFILDFILNKYRDIKQGDRNRLISKIIFDQSINSEILMHFFHGITSSLNDSMESEDIIYWINRFFSCRSIFEYCTQNIPFVLAFIQADLRDKIIRIIVDQSKIFQSPENIVKLLVYNFELLNLDFRKELMNYVMDDSTVYLVALNILGHFKSLTKETRETYIEILYDKLKNNEIFGGFIILYYDLIPRTISNSYLEESVEIEERLFYMFRFMINHYRSLEKEFRNKLLFRISKYNNIFGKAIRNLLINNLDIQGTISNKLKPKKINKKIKEMQNQILNRLDSELINILKMFEYDVLFYERLRKRYYPKKLKYLILIEGLTPKEKYGTDYFYNPYSKNLDILFKHLVPLIFPQSFELETPEGREELLLNLAKQGFYLEDVFPMKIYDEGRKDALNLWIRKSFLPKIRKKISKDIYIIIIGEELHEILYNLLRTGGYQNLNKQKVPYPTNKNSELFKTRFGKILKEFNYT